LALAIDVAGVEEEAADETPPRIDAPATGPQGGSA